MSSSVVSSVAASSSVSRSCRLVALGQVSGHDPALGERRVATSGIGQAHRDLGEVRSGEPRLGEAGVGQRGDEVARLDRRQLGDLAQPGRADRGQVGGRRQRHQRLVRADVARRLLATDVLLARLQGEDVSLAARRVAGRADEASGHLPHRRHPRRHQPDVRAAEAGRNAERLSLRGHDVGAVRRRARSSSAREVGSTTATSWAPAACVTSASSDIGSSWP